MFGDGENLFGRLDDNEYKDEKDRYDRKGWMKRQRKKILKYVRVVAVQQIGVQFDMSIGCLYSTVGFPRCFCRAIHLSEQSTSGQIGRRQGIGIEVVAAGKCDFYPVWVRGLSPGWFQGSGHGFFVIILVS